MISAILYRLIKKKRIGDWYWNSIIVYFIAVKISYIVFNYQLFLKTPLSIIYFSGGEKGQFLATICLAIYLLFHLRRGKQTVLSEFIPIYLPFFLLYQIVLHAFKENITAMIFELLLLLFFMIMNNYQNRFETIKLFIVSILLESLLLSFFNELLTISNLSIVTIGGLIVGTYFIQRGNAQS
ncbi:hypothetical protein ACQKCU_04170 [Heyndrickxia sporothermodurans]